MKVLFIGTVWPEPTSSAAGLRSLDLVRACRRAGWEVVFAAPSKENAFSEALVSQGIPCHTVQANDPAFDALIAGLKPDFTIFDRFMTEEQFGWRVRAHAPECVRVLDTIDLHLLRRARARELENRPGDAAALEDVFDSKIELRTEDALREIASIYRSDLTLVISSFEMGLLAARFGVPAELLLHVPFSYAPRAAAPGFGERSNFAMIGNFRHPPNADAVLWLKNGIWPLIRAEMSRAGLPAAEVHVYGAYPSKRMMDLTDAGSGFHVRGPARDQYETLARYRVNLAPLRFGAGLKGKISDGWWSGAPAVTTPIGAEGMTLPDGRFGGEVERTPEALARAAIRLYQSAREWEAAVAAGHETLDKVFGYESNADAFIARLARAHAERENGRAANFVGAMLSHHLHQSTTYFSRWIELKRLVPGLQKPGI